MIIDFHTHVFPDKIAARTIELLSEKSGIAPTTDGTVRGLLSSMERAGIDISITLPVLTNPKSFESVNRFAAEINERFSGEGKRLVSFGGIHPACEDIEGKMSWLKKSGFLGVKIHPDYQGTYIDDLGYEKIMNAAMENDLIVLTHAGVDVAYPDDVHCTPERTAALLSRAPHSKLVLAHMGGVELRDRFFELFLGSEVYFDTAFVLKNTSSECFTELLRKHGEDKFLFATDAPWSEEAEDVKILKSYGLPKATLEKLFFKNAIKLLGI